MDPQKKTTSRVLVSWIGHNDLRGLASSLSGEEQLSVLSQLPRTGGAEGVGPIKCLLDLEAFQQVHLLYDGDKGIAKRFSSWLDANTVLHPVRLTNPTDYSSIFEAVDLVLSKRYSRWRESGFEVCFHLSPGTPAMTAIWVLLGKSIYPATFYQTHKGKAWITEIPFDLSVDYIPHVLRSQDLYLQHLAAYSPGQVKGFEEIIGDSQAIRLAVGRARQAAAHDVPVLLLGETGTGKEMFARAIHASSRRSEGPFVAVNCAAIPKELLESYLFGHAKGAFTGAIKESRGAFEEANGGTLFLDEVGECDPSMQAKLLRVLQPEPGDGLCVRTLRRVGDAKDRKSDVRLVAATNRDLIEEISCRRFREDLYYRLAIISIKLPSLRDRKSDLGHLAEALCSRINAQFRERQVGYKDKKLSGSANAFVKSHPWPGNVRQLYNAILQAVVMCDGDVIERSGIAAAVAEMPGRIGFDDSDLPLGDGFSLENHLNQIQKHFLERALREAGGVKAKAAKLLGLKSYQALDAQLKRLKVTVPRL